MGLTDALRKLNFDIHAPFFGKFMDSIFSAKDVTGSLEDSLSYGFRWISQFIKLGLTHGLVAKDDNLEVSLPRVEEKLAGENITVAGLSRVGRNYLINLRS